MPIDQLRVRASYQRAVRAPELRRAVRRRRIEPAVLRSLLGDEQRYAPAPTAAQIAGTMPRARRRVPAQTALRSDARHSRSAPRWAPTSICKPEKADTFTLGLVWQPAGRRLLEAACVGRLLQHRGRRTRWFNRTRTCTSRTATTCYGRNPNVQHAQLRQLRRASSVRATSCGVDNPLTIRMAVSSSSRTTARSRPTVSICR